MQKPISASAAVCGVGTIERDRPGAARACLVLLAGLCGLALPGALAAQTGWSANLIVNPFPSPYLSDWQTNPGTALLTVTNDGAQTGQVTIHFTVVNQLGELMLNGRSDPQLVAAGMTAQYDATTELGVTADYNADLETQVSRTGRFPEGDFTACVTLTDPSGFVVARDICADFSTFYPDPPYLILPLDQDTVRDAAPIFEWTPLQLPLSVSATYVVQIAEVLSGQTPYAALTSNVLHHEEPALFASLLSYPVNALPFENGKQYAWWVQALDRRAMPLATNQGRSEIWTFVYDDGDGSGDDDSEVFGSSASVELVHEDAATGPLANLATATYETVRDQLTGLDDEDALQLPLPFPDLNVFQAIPLSNVQVTTDDASRTVAVGGDITILGQTAQVLLTGVWNGADRVFALGLRPVDFRLDDLISGLDGSSLANLDFGESVLTLASASGQWATRTMPFTVESFYDGATLALAPGLSVSNDIDLSQGPIADALRALGIEPGRAHVEGDLGVDPNALFDDAGPRTAPGLRLLANLNIDEVTWLPDWLTAERVGVEFSNDPSPSGALALVVGADFGGSTQRFDLRAALSGDGDSSTVQLSGRMQGPWREPFGLTWLTLDSTELWITPSDPSAGGAAAAGLRAQLTVGSQPLDVAIDLLGGDEPVATFTVSAESLGFEDLLTVVAQRLGGAAISEALPSNLIALTDVAISFSSSTAAFTATATATVLGQSSDFLYTVVPGLPAAEDRSTPSLFAFRFADWSLGSIFSSLQGTGIGDLSFPSVTLSFGEFGEAATQAPGAADSLTNGGDDGAFSLSSVDLPDLAIDFFRPTYGTGGGDFDLPLGPGVNFGAPLSFDFLPEGLASFLDFDTEGGGAGGASGGGGSGPVLGGSLGFGIGDLLTSGFGAFDLSRVDLEAELPPLSSVPFGYPDWLRPTSQSLALVTQPGLSFRVHKVMETGLGGETQVFDFTADIGLEGGELSGALEGVMRGGWDRPFGLEWLALDSVRLEVSSGSVGKRAALASTMEIGQVRGSLAIAIEGAGDERTALFTATVDQISSSDIVSFVNNAFGASLAEPQTPVTLDSLMLGFGTGEAAGFDISARIARALTIADGVAIAETLLPGDLGVTPEVDVGGLASGAFDFHWRPDSTWGGVSGALATADPASTLQGTASLRFGQAVNDAWMSGAVAVSIGAVSVENLVADAAAYMAGSPDLSGQLGPIAGLALDSARADLGFDTRTDSVWVDMNGDGSISENGSTTRATASFGVDFVGEDTWSRGNLQIQVDDVSLPDMLDRVVAFLPGEWGLPDGFEAFETLHLDTAALDVGFDQRADSTWAHAFGFGTLGQAPSDLAAQASLSFSQRGEESWVRGQVDVRMGATTLADALTDIADILPGDWGLPADLSAFDALALDSASLGLGFDTGFQSTWADLTGHGYFDGTPRLDADGTFSFLQVANEKWVSGRVGLRMGPLTVAEALTQVAGMLPGDWGLPSDFSTFDAASLDSASLELGFDTRADSSWASVAGAGSIGSGGSGLAIEATLDFVRQAADEAVRGQLLASLGAMTMADALDEIGQLLPGDWSLSEDLDALDAVALDSAVVDLGFDTKSDSIWAAVVGGGSLNDLQADARLAFNDVGDERWTVGEATLAMSSVSLPDVVNAVAGLLPGDWELSSDFALDGLSMDEVALTVGFDTRADSLWAGMEGVGSLNQVRADGRLGFFNVASGSYATGSVTLALGNLSLAETFDWATDLLPGQWSVPEVDFDLGSLEDLSFEVGFNTRADSVWATANASATLANRSGTATIGIYRLGADNPLGAGTWIGGGFSARVGDLGFGDALELAADFLPGNLSPPALDFDIGSLRDVTVGVGFTSGPGVDSSWAALHAGFALGRQSGTGIFTVGFTDGEPQGRFVGRFNNSFGVSDIVDVVTGFVPGVSLDIPDLFDLSVDDVALTLEMGARSGVSLGATANLFNKKADVLFSLARIEGRPQLVAGFRVPDLGLTDLVPDFENPVTDALRLSSAAMVLTKAEGRSNSSELSPETRQFFQPLMGRENFNIDWKTGLNLVGALPVDPDGPLADILALLSPGGTSQLTITGTLPILGGGLQNLALAAALPPVAPPGSPDWFVEGQLAFEITGRPSVGVIGDLTLNFDGDTLTFFIKSSINIIPAGGVELAIAGGLKAVHPWEEPLGVDWLTINEVVLTAGLSPVAVRFGFLGDAVIGPKDFRLAAGIAINIYTGVPIGVLFLGESEAGLSLSDIAAVQQQMTGNALPLPTDVLPNMALRDLGLRIATYSDFDLGVEAGFGMRGRFFIEVQRGQPMTEWGRMLIDISLEGIRGEGLIGPFTLGPIKFDSAYVNLELSLLQQSFVLAGSAEIADLIRGNIELALSRDSMAFSTEVQVFNAFRAQLEARAAFDFLNPQFQGRFALYNDFGDELAYDVINDLIPVGQGVVLVAGQTLSAANTALNGADQALQAAIYVAGAAPKAAMDAAYSSYRSAVSQYNSANSKYKHYRKKCSWKRPWHCGKKSYYYGKRNYWSAQKSIRYGLYVTARSVYQNRSYLQNNPAIDGLKFTRDQAQIVYDAAAAEYNKIKSSLDALVLYKTMYESCKTCPLPPAPFSVLSAEFEASLAGFTGDSGVQMTIGYQVLGDRDSISLGFSGSIADMASSLFQVVSDALF